MKYLRRLFSALILIVAPFALLVSLGSAKNDSSRVVTLSGVVSDTFSSGGHDAVATFDSQKNQTALTIFFSRKTIGSSQGVVTLALSFPGAIRNGSFSLPGENTSGLAAYHETSPARTWLADKSHGGSLTINITSTQPVMSGSDKASYLHGSARATMPAVASTGATGVIQLQATF
jgi:hypothetical protein